MAIDRKLVVRAALEQLDASGLDALTLRRIGTELNIQASALYWHFKGKQELLDFMAQEILSEEFAVLRPLGAAEPWAVWLAEQAMALRNALLRHRDGARVVAGASFGRAVILGYLLDRMTDVLNRGAGLPLADSVRSAASVVQYTIGFSIEEQSAPDPQQPVSSDLMERLPVLARAMSAADEPGDGASVDYRHGLDLLLRGIASLAAERAISAASPERPADR